MVDQTIALQVRPLDVATPLLTAARIKQSQMEQQQQQIAMSRDAIGAEARGLAPYVGKPEYAQMAQASKMRLIQQGVINSPEAEAGFDRDIGSGSPLALQSIIARTQDPRLGESIRHNQAIEAQSAASLGETSRHNKAVEEQGKIIPSMDPLTGEARIYRITPNGAEIVSPQGGVSSIPGGSPSAVAPKATATDLMVKYGGKPDDGRDWEYLASLPAAAQDKVVRLVNHDLNPANYSMRIAAGAGQSPRDAITTAAARFDKTYNQQDYPNIQKSRQAFNTGPQGNAVRSFNVAIDHLQVLRDLAMALNNGDVRVINSLRNKWREQFGSDLPTNFDAVKSIVGSEISKAVQGSNGALQDREELRGPLNNASSPAQLAGVIDKAYMPLMVGQLQGLKKQYDTSTRRTDFEDKLSETAKATMKPTARGPQMDSQVLTDARTAIAKGAPREAVEKRLKERGIQFKPSDLDLQ